MQQQIQKKSEVTGIYLLLLLFFSEVIKDKTKLLPQESQAEN
jgi:hypothetical protein